LQIPYCAVSSPEQIAWTGFKQDTEILDTKKIIEKGEKITRVTKYVSGKTLWDWLGVLGIPLALAVLGLLQQRRAEKQAALEKAIAESNQKEEVLQAYFDRLAALLIDKNLSAIAVKAESGDATREDQELLSASRNVVRARTLSILRRLGGDGYRKGSVMQFVAEAEVISKLKLDLSFANLNGADLWFANLGGADLRFAEFKGAFLSGADLSNAELRFAELRGAFLGEADLSNANLWGTDLSSTDLSSADISGAYLGAANLSGANLKDANLSGADLNDANLSRADLSLAVGLTAEQVSTARLCKTKLPPDIQLDPDRDCKELEKDAQEIFF
jgi:uncharacterized protein YjbI with pentapeptide repeats